MSQCWTGAGMLSQCWTSRTRPVESEEGPSKTLFMFKIKTKIMPQIQYLIYIVNVCERNSIVVFMSLTKTFLLVHAPLIILNTVNRNAAECHSVENTNRSLYNTYIDLDNITIAN